MATEGALTHDFDQHAGSSAIAVPREVQAPGSTSAQTGGPVAGAGAASDDERSSLLALAGRSDPTLFLVAAVPWLAGHPEEVELRLRAVRLAVVVGLPEVALALLRELPETLARHPDLQLLTRQIASSEPRALSTGELTAQFDTNLRTLRSRQEIRDDSGVSGRADLACTLQSDAPMWRERHRVYRDRAGRTVIAQVAPTREVDNTPDVSLERLTWYPDTAGQALLHAPLPHEGDMARQQVICPPPYIFIGLRPTELLLRIERETRAFLQGYQPAIHVLVHDEASLVTAMHIADLSPVLASDRVSWYVGADATARLIDHLNTEATAMLPRYVLPTVPPPNRITSMVAETALRLAHDDATQVSAAVHDVHESRLRRDLERQGRVAAIYRSRDAAWWKKRYAEALHAETEVPLRIMIPVSRFTTYVRHAARQLEGALRRAGHDARILTEPSDHTVISASSYLHMLAEWQPDLVIEIDHLQHEKVNILPESLPHLCWVQDRLPNLYSDKAGANIGPWQVVAGVGVRELVGHFGYPADRSFTVLNGTDTTVYRPDPLPESELEAHRCDLAWVSNHSTPPEMYMQTLVRDATKAGAERAAAEWVARRVFRMFDEVDRCEPTHRLKFAQVFNRRDRNDPAPMPLDGAAQRTLYDFIVLPLADRIARHQALRWVIAWCRDHDRTLRLYGNGWEDFPETRPFACGVVENGRNLRAVYQAARVNLHMSVYGAMHQRVLDGFASGGFVLSRRAACDVSGAIVRAALPDIDARGRDRIRLNHAPNLRAFLGREMFRGGSVPELGEQRLRSGSDREFWDFGGPAWAWWFEPRPRCAFRSFDDLVPEYENVTFATEAELRARLDAVIDQPDVRHALAEPIRQRIAEELSTDAIGRYFVALVRTRVRHLAGG